MNLPDQAVSLKAVRNKEVSSVLKIAWQLFQEEAGCRILRGWKGKGDRSSNARHFKCSSNSTSTGSSKEGDSSSIAINNLVIAIGY